MAGRKFSCRGRNCAFCYRWWMLSGGSPGRCSTVRGPAESILARQILMIQHKIWKYGQIREKFVLFWYDWRRQNVYSNLYSQAVTHPSTNRSQPCLTSVIGRELVYSRWYGRRHLQRGKNSNPSTKNAENDGRKVALIVGVVVYSSCGALWLCAWEGWIPYHSCSKFCG